MTESLRYYDLKGVTFSKRFTLVICYLSKKQLIPGGGGCFFNVYASRGTV